MLELLICDEEDATLVEDAMLLEDTALLGAGVLLEDAMLLGVGVILEDAALLGVVEILEDEAAASEPRDSDEFTKLLLEGVVAPPHPDKAKIDNIVSPLMRLPIFDRRIVCVRFIVFNSRVLQFE